MQQLNEAYFGNEDISSISKLFYKVLDNFKGKTYSSSMNVDKDLIKFNREVEQFFGYNTYSLFISPSDEINAYAFPIDIYCTRDERKILLDALSSSRKFKHDSRMGRISAISTITIGMINSGLLNEEIFAILLHGIEYTFVAATTGKDCLYTINQKIINVFKKINTKLILSFSRVDDSISEENISKDIDQFMDDFWLVEGFIKPSNIMYAISNNHKYDENSFGTFCSMYGFETQLRNGIERLCGITYNHECDCDNHTDLCFMILKKINCFLNHYNRGMFEEFEKCPQEKADCIRDKLSIENLDPNMKNRILDQINDLQVLINDYSIFPKSEDNLKIVKQYYSELYNILGGKSEEN